MWFNSVTFALFLPLVFAVHWLVPRKGWQNGVLLVASYVFYGWWDWRFLSLIAISTLVDYGAGLALGATDRRARRRATVVASLVVNLGLLGFFKYFGFFVDSAVTALEALGFHAHRPTLAIVLPVGISFYTFQTLSYTIDVYRRRIRPCRNLLDYGLYVSFFPQLVAGPIERGTRLLPQFVERRRFDHAAAVDGTRQMMWGFFKKMVVADQIAPIVDAAYADPLAAGGPMLFAATALFAFQIYCDFSGYSDIAIGCARWFGIDLCRNFGYPYFSQSLREFWHRWHISLSTWFRDYLYIPLGGSRVPAWRRDVNIMITFVLSGLWHGASWTFVAWGAIHGLGVISEMRLPRTSDALPLSATPGGERNLPRPGTVARMVGTFALVCAAWVFFRAGSIGEVGVIYHRILADGLDLAAWGAMFSELAGSAYLPPLIAVGVVLAVEWIQRREPDPVTMRTWPRWLRWLVYTIIFWAALYYGTRSTGPFVYFQF